MQVLRDGDQEGNTVEEFGPSRCAYDFLPQWVANRDESIQGEDDQNPDRGVGRSEEEELLQFARDRMNFLELGVESVFEPFRDHTDHEDAQVRESHQE